MAIETRKRTLIIVELNFIFGFLYDVLISLMAQEHQDKNQTVTLLEVALALLNSDVLRLLTAAWKLGKRILSAKAHEGMYEVLEYESRLVIHDPKAEKATLYKREKVRFLQGSIIAYQDKAWGEGNIFASYKCSPGVPVDRYREGSVFRVLISLREAKERGDIEEFHIERGIHNGYPSRNEYHQTDIDHEMKQLTLNVVFPLKRPPKKIMVFEKNTRRATVLGPEYFRTMPDGCQQVTWHTDKPRLFESYILRWEW